MVNWQIHSIKKTEKWRKISKRLKNKHRRLIEIQTVRKTNRHKDGQNNSHIEYTKRQKDNQKDRQKDIRKARRKY